MKESSSAPILPALQPHIYKVLARRARPQALSQLVGQETIVQSLGKMLASARLPHAFLFTGTRGVGKTSAARILAKSLNCERGPTSTPCQTCVHCRQIALCAHEDVLEVDAASNTGVDNVRELQESTRFFPASARYKVYIIDEVHMLSTGAFNALLKILEEPPPQVVFVLATTELHKVPVTVRSRCILFNFKKVTAERIADHMLTLLKAEGVDCDADSLMLIAREGKGSVRDALSLLEQVLAYCGGQHLDFKSTQEALGLSAQRVAQELFAAVCLKSSSDCIQLLHAADDSGVDLAHVLEATAHLFQAALIIKEEKDPSKVQKLFELLPHEVEFIRTHARSASVAALSEIFRTLWLSARDVTKTTSGLAWAQCGVLDCVTRMEWLSAGELLALLKAPASSNEVVQVDTFSEILRNIEKKSPGLAAKLKMAKLDHFSPSLIRFSQVNENKIFAQLSATDKELFENELKNYGWHNVKVVFFQDGQPELRKESDAAKPNTSVAEVEKKRVAEDLKHREQAVRQLPIIQNLIKLADSVTFKPLEEDGGQEGEVPTPRRS